MACAPAAFKNCDDLFAAGLGQMIREKAAIAYDHSKCHFALRCHVLAPSIVVPAYDC